MSKAGESTERAARVDGGMRFGLTFEHRHQIGRIIEEEDDHLVVESISGSASLSACLSLIRSIERIVAIAEAVSRGPAVEGRDPTAPAGVLSQLEAVELRETHASVELLRYGSPFEIQVLVGALTVPGLGVLLYGAKRLFAIDLEFRAYRERRRAEYIRAKKVAEILETAPPEVLGRLLLTKEIKPLEAWMGSNGFLEEEDP